MHPEDLDQICDQLTADLMALVNVETGGPVITGVDKSSRSYRRSPEDALPDLSLDWGRGGLIETVSSPKPESCMRLTSIGARAITAGGTVNRLWSRIPSSTVLPSVEVEDSASILGNSV